MLMAVSIPTGKFLRITTDEGPVISGFSLHSFYNDCHRPTYTGVNIVSFSTDVPSEKQISDFDITKKRDGLHVSTAGQVAEMVLDESIGQVRQALKRLDARFLKLREGTLEQSLLREYVSSMHEFEARVARGDMDGLAKHLGAFGRRESNSFIGYKKKEGQEYGLNGAKLDTESASDLIGATINIHVTPQQFATAYSNLTGTSLHFWPVEQIPAGRESIRFSV